MRREGFEVNKKRVHRLWRQEGLKVFPTSSTKGGAFWVKGENGAKRKRAEHSDHVWSYDYFVIDRTENGHQLKM